MTMTRGDRALAEARHLRDCGVAPTIAVARAAAECAASDGEEVALRRELTLVLMDDLDRAGGAARHRVVCAWCEDVLEEGDPGAEVSHGMCEACEAAVEPELALVPAPELPRSCCATCDLEAHHAAGLEAPAELVAEVMRPRNPVVAEWLRAGPEEPLATLDWDAVR